MWSIVGVLTILPKAHEIDLRVIKESSEDRLSYLIRIMKSVELDVGQNKEIGSKNREREYLCKKRTQVGTI